MEFVRREGAVAASAADFDVVFRAEYPVLFRQALLIVGDRSAAEDVVQDVFAKAWVRWRRVGVLERPGGWLQTSVVRAAVRAKQRRPIWSELVDAGEAPVVDGGLSTAVVEALAALSSKQRAAFVLSVVEGLSSAEIASVLGCGEATVRVHVHRARTALAGGGLVEVSGG